MADPYETKLLAKVAEARALYPLENVGPITREQRQVVHDLCDSINHLLNLSAGHKEMIAELRASASA